MYCKIRKGNEKPVYTIGDMLIGAIGLAIGASCLTALFLFIFWLMVEAIR